MTLTQGVHGAPKARLRLELSSRQTLAEDLAWFGEFVGPRVGPYRRTKAEIEEYTLRRWLLAMILRDKLTFPMVIEAPEDHGTSAADFELRSTDSSKPLAIEITTATTPEWERHLASIDRGPASDIAVLDPGDGWAGSGAEKRVVDDVKSAIHRKIGKNSYGPPSRAVLVIYDNSSGALPNSRDTEFDRLMWNGLNGERIAIQHTFRRVSLVRGNVVYLNLLSTDPNDFEKIDLSDHYLLDFEGWLRRQAASLRAHDIAALDYDNIAEELEGLARKDARAIESQLVRLLMHLLKWQFQPTLRSPSWTLSIDDARLEIEDLLAVSPSLKRHLAERYAIAFEKARRWAARETGIEIDAFPEESPYHFNEVLSHQFLPKE